MDLEIIDDRILTQAGRGKQSSKQREQKTQIRNLFPPHYFSIYANKVGEGFSSFWEVFFEVILPVDLIRLQTFPCDNMSFPGLPLKGAVPC